MYLDRAHFVPARYFKCFLDYAKRSFRRATNCIFGKIGRVAFEESARQLIKGKCLPILWYGLETCPLKARSSLDFTFFPRII